MSAFPTSASVPPPTAYHAADSQPMPHAEYGRLLNTLLEAERAGAKLLAAYLDELPPGTGRWIALHAIERDEAHNCAVLIHLLLDADVEPTMAVGEFYRKGLAIHGWRERLEFLNRRQAWVAKRIAAASPRISQLGQEPSCSRCASRISTTSRAAINC